MIERLARILVQRPVAWAVVALTLLVGGVCAVLALDVEQDDDVLAFLPQSNPDIRAFREIADTFRSTDVALVGIATPDPFAPDFVVRLQGLTRALRDTPGIDAALTLTNVQDFVEDPDGGGIVTSELIPEPPADDTAREALRVKVMSRDHIVGTLVSEDADAVLVYAFAAPGAEPREVATRVRAAVLESFPDHEIYWGGAPFISTWIYETTQADMARLTPWAVLAILLVMAVAFRDALGTVLGLLATAVGIAASRAAMAVLGVSFNIVLSSMPIILFAVGSAYAIHILSRYDHHAREVGPSPEAVVRTLTGTGPTVIAAGLTTVAGLLSFVTMDIEPMRTFGVFTALGLVVALVTSLTFVPALMALYPRPVRRQQEGAWQGLMVRMAMGVRSHRSVSLVIAALVCTVGVGLAGRVDARMDLRAFFDEGTEPDVAQLFLERAFGGSQFIQVQVSGDLGEPAVLRAVGAVSDRIRAVPHVTDVRGIDDVLEIVHEAMAGTRRIPDTEGQTGAIYRFGTSDPATGQLVTEDHGRALLQIKLGTSDADELDEALAQVREVVATYAPTTYRIARADEDAEAVATALQAQVARRALALAEAFDVGLPDDALERATAVLEGPAPPPVGEGVGDAITTFLASDESFVVLTAEQAAAVGQAVALLGDAPDPDALAGAVASALGVPTDDATVQDLLVVLDAPLSDAWRGGRARAWSGRLVEGLGAQVPDTAAGLRFRSRLADTLQDLGAPTVLLPSEAPDAASLDWVVSGMPVLYQGLSRSVTANQFKSLGSALVLVVLILSIYYRSLSAGLLATAPTFATLAVVYGLMGASGVHLDIGTSMLASIVIGAGVDYGVHLMAGWEAPASGGPEGAVHGAVHETSHAIWTNAIMVAAGFFVLTLGDARPLKNVGGLTGTAMLVAALATFVMIPLLANRRSYPTVGASTPPRP